jgi:cell shape-determining protein MreC
MQAKAVRFLREVAGEPERAEEFAAMSPEEYAEHKRVEIRNAFSRAASQRRNPMRRPTYADLKERVDELEEENQALNEKLDSIADIASTEEEDEENEEEVD